VGCAHFRGRDASGQRQNIAAELEYGQEENRGRPGEGRISEPGRCSSSVAPATFGTGSIRFGRVGAADADDEIASPELCFKVCVKLNRKQPLIRNGSIASLAFSALGSPSKSFQIRLLLSRV